MGIKNNRLHAYFHLTHPRARESFDSANIHPLSQKNVIFGRPNVESYFKQMEDAALRLANTETPLDGKLKSETNKKIRIGVFICIY